MRYPAPLVEGVFLRRYKRFFADVEIDGQTVTAHCPNTGSMRACTEDRAPVRLLWHDNPKRKLPWTLEQICVDGRWILVNTGRPNRVVEEAVREGRIPELQGYDVVQRERRLGDSRVDLLLLDGADDPEVARRICWVEVKNVTLVEGGVARFPDAVTARGTKHLRELAAALGPGRRAVLMLHVGHEGGEIVRPADDLDPVWAETVREAASQGVEVLARRCRMDGEGLVLGEAVPVDLS